MSSLKLDWRTAEKKAIREGIGEGLLRIGGDERVVVLTADLAGSTRADEFARRYPKRFLQLGVAEQNMAGVAAGLASEGMIPVMTSFAVFSPGRNWEQIRTTIALAKLNVKIVSTHGGVSVGQNGPTHQATEDIALMRVLPGMTVLTPADAEECAAAVEAAVKMNGPVYIRAARPDTWQLYEKRSEFEVGKIGVVRSGKDLTVAACGIMVGQALLLADKMAQEEVELEVLNVSTIKPMDVETLAISARKTGKVVTLEDHQVEGGMGSAVAEILADELPVKVKRIGLENTFGVTGEWEEVYKKFGLDLVSLEMAVKSVLD